jgi:hypothetical protein
MTAIHRDHVARFHAFLNSIHDSIKWTFESEVNGRIDMLDLTILRQPYGSLEFDIFRKPTHTNQYIAWDSDQPLQHKGSTILSLTRRARLLSTGHTRQTAELKRVHQALALNGFPPWAIRRYRHRHLPPAPPLLPANAATPQLQTQTPSTAPATTKHRATISLPYHRGTSEIISRAFRKADMGIISTNRNSLCTQLIDLKDSIPHTHKSSVIYYAPCAGNTNDPCIATYIGETERSMRVRLKEHHNKVTLQNSDEYTSAIGQHARTTNHHFRAENVTYLARESNKIARGIKEAIYARALDPLSTGEVDCDIFSRICTIALSQPPYAQRNPHRPVLTAPQRPPSTSTALDPRAVRRDLATVHSVSHSSTPPSPWLQPRRPLRKPPLRRQQLCAALAAPAKTLPSRPPGPPCRCR